MKFEAATLSKDLALDFKASIYPNPTSESKVFLNINEKSLFDGTATYTIYNPLGAKISIQKLLSNELNLPTERGIYVVKIQHPTLGEMTQKVVLK